MSHDYNFWIHFPAAVIVVILGYLFRVSKDEWSWLLLAIALVWVAEFFNTCIEKITDYVHPEKGLVAKEIKDISAGAVLIISVFALVIGGMIFLPYFLTLIGK